MNTSIIFPTPVPTLTLARPSAEKWATALREERRRLLEDQAALREREQNLRDYEARLRALQEEFAAGRGPTRPAPTGITQTLLSRATSWPPIGDVTALQSGWEKLHRTRELLAAEQAHVREDRHALREQESAVKRREAAVAVREQQLAEHETHVAAERAASAEAIAGEHAMSAVSRLTRMPFDMARSVFGGRK